jgi:hypothetical protein
MPHKGRAVTRAPLATDFPPPEKYPNQVRLSTDTDGFGRINGTHPPRRAGSGAAGAGRDAREIIGGMHRAVAGQGHETLAGALLVPV